MKHLVVVVGLYFPEPSPTGKVARQYINLIKDKFIVDVIFIQNGSSYYNGETVNNEKLYSLSGWRTSLLSSYKKENKSVNIMIKRYAIQLKITVLKVIGFIQDSIIFPNNLYWFYKKAIFKLNEIHEREPIDYIFTINSPFSAHLSGFEFKRKHPATKWISYTVDPYYRYFGIGGNMQFYRRKKAFQNEKRILSNSDICLFSKEIAQNRPDLFSDFLNKSYVLPYLLEKNARNMHTKFFDQNYINVIYMGKFYKDIRNPEIMLQTFLGLNNEKIILHLFSSGNCEGIIDYYENLSSGRIIRHKTVPQEYVIGILNNADILINISNIVADFAPSKIFEYISTGKPIINFSQSKILDSLEKYPLVLNIFNNTPVEERSIRLEEFCIKVKGKEVSQSILEKLYFENTESYIRNLLLGFFDES